MYDDAKVLLDQLHEQGMDTLLELNDNTLEAAYYNEEEEALYLLYKDKTNYECIYRFYRDIDDWKRIMFDKILSLHDFHNYIKINREVEI